jgi:hypothetical protein
MHAGFWRGNLKEIDMSEDLGIDEKIKWNLSRIDWVELVRGREKWQAVVNTVMNLREFLRQLRDCFPNTTMPRGVNLSNRFCPELKHRHVAVASFTYVPPAMRVTPY